MGYQELWSEMLLLMGKAGLSQVQLAKGAGLDRSTLRNIREGTTGTTLRTLEALSGALDVHWSHLAGLLYGDPVPFTGQKPLDWEMLYPDGSVRVARDTSSEPPMCEWSVGLRNCGTLPWVSFSLVYTHECALLEEVPVGDLVPLGHILDYKQWRSPAVLRLGLDERYRERPIMLPGEEETIVLRFVSPRADMNSTRTWCFVDMGAPGDLPKRVVMDWPLLLWIFIEDYDAALLVTDGRLASRD